MQINFCMFRKKRIESVIFYLVTFRFWKDMDALMNSECSRNQGTSRPQRVDDIDVMPREDSECIRRLVSSRIKELTATERIMSKESVALSKVCEIFTDRLVSVKRELVQLREFEVRMGGHIPGSTMNFMETIRHVSRDSCEFQRDRDERKRSKRQRQR